MKELEAPGASVPRPTFSRPREFFHIVRRNRGALIGGSIVSVFVIIAIVVGVTSYFFPKLILTPYNPITQGVGPYLGGPSSTHYFGTDNLERDVFSRIIYAIPADIEVSFAVIVFALAVGGVVGSFAAYRGGVLEEALMRATDVFFGIPGLILAMAIAAVLGPGLVNMMIALMIIWWPAYARLARGESLKVSHQNYVEAAKLAGSGPAKIILKHVIPNISLTLLVYATLDIGTVILTYAGLSYFGLSLRPPAPDLGYMVSNYQDFILTAYWLPLFPGLIIALQVIGFSIFGDGLRDSLESA